MTESIVAATALGLALIPAILVTRNLGRFRTLPRVTQDSPSPPVSVLIPARNEEATIEEAVRSALASRNVELEVLVGDDGSADATRERVLAVAGGDPRVRLVDVPALPPGWCGKQHACAILAREARHAVLVFVDADVRLAPDALARAARFLAASDVALLSGFPREKTRGFAERAILPLIHFVLLGFLPIGRMRAGTAPAYAAGCGQIFIAKRGAYERSGGHAAIRSSRHDGITLPRAFRRTGAKTDIFDARDVASCRMYSSARELWSGLSKNATEGLGTPATIVPWTVVLIGGQVLPFVLVALECFRSSATVSHGVSASFFIAAAGALVSFATRILLAVRFRQSIAGALVHPFGVSALVLIQWSALLRRALGLPASWRGRTYRDATERPIEAIDHGPPALSYDTPRREQASS